MNVLPKLLPTLLFSVVITTAGHLSAAQNLPLQKPGLDQAANVRQQQQVSQSIGQPAVSGTAPIILRPIMTKPEYSRLKFTNRGSYFLNNYKLAHYFGDPGNTFIVLSDLQPPIRDKAQILIQDLTLKGENFNPAYLRDLLNTAQNSALEGMDIDALMQLVMFECAKAAADDTRELLAEMQRSNKQKQETRSMLDRAKSEREKIRKQLQDEINKSGQTSVGRCRSLINCQDARLAQIEVSVKALESKMDALAEFGKTLTLRLQMAMDRMAKFYSILSNLLKKLSDTATGIVSNMK